MVEQITPVPGGRYIAVSSVNEAWVGLITRLIDMSGTELWRLEGDSAGDVLQATSTFLLLRNDRWVSRVSLETGAIQELVALHANEEVEVSPGGASFLIMGRTGGTLYDRDGRTLGTVPPGSYAEFSQDGEYLLIRRSRTSYSLHTAKGEQVWQTELANSPSTFSLSPDGRHFLVARRDAEKGGLLVNLYGETGTLDWSSFAEMPPADRNKTIRSTFDYMENVYISLGSSIWSWPLTPRM